MLRALCLIITLFASLSGLAQSATGYRIEGRIRGLRDTTIRLAHFFGYSQYIAKDTARIDADGRFVFEGTQTLPQGLYIVMPPTARQQYIELVLGTSRFAFETDTAGYSQHMRVVGSPDNEAFYAYQQQVQRLADEVKAIELQARFRTDPTSQLTAKRQVAAVKKQVVTLQHDFLKKDPSLLVVKLLRAATDPDVPPPPRAPAGQIDSTFQYRYYKNHFWDNFDFSDERLVRTPVFQRKIDRYLREMTPQLVDSLIQSAEVIVSKAKVNNEVLSYAIWYITSQYERPRLMGTDGVFIHMAETYYLTGLMPNLDPATREQIRRRVNTLKPLLVGNTFPPLAASDTLRQPVDLKAIKADYTVLYFYDPTCVHCRQSMPKLKQYADQVRGQGIQFCAISVDNSPEAWQAFIREFGIQNWVNGYDFTFRTDYRSQFDVLKTPTVYILDQNKTILARALPAEQVADFIQFQRNISK